MLVITAALTTGVVITLTLSVVGWWGAQTLNNSPSQRPAEGWFVGPGTSVRWGWTESSSHFATITQLVNYGSDASAEEAISRSPTPQSQPSAPMRGLPSSNPDAMSLFFCRVGVPFRCFGSAVSVDHSHRFGLLAGTKVTKAQSWIAPSSPGVFSSVIPSHVDVLPFAGDTGIFAVPVFGLVCSIRYFRTWRRRSAGLCLACGYGAFPGDSCPECGARRAATMT